MRLGILGGTFDPVHTGHLIVAQEAHTRLGLSRVLFVPAGRPWLKGDRVKAAGRHRLAMLKAAVQDNPAFEVSSAELDRPGPSYTVETLEGLRGQLGPGARLFFILGADSFADLGRWREPGRLLELCTMVVLSRPGAVGPSPGELEALRPGASNTVVHIEGLEIGISATEVRKRVAEGRPIRYWVPAPVEEYIAENRLYRQEG